jgi:D-alanine-D-alanine ligase
MKVGITYDLRDDYLASGFSEEEIAEFDRRETIDAIDHTLQGLGYTTDWIGNVRALIARLAVGDRWDLVFNIAEGLRGYGREAQVPALLDVYQIPYTFSDPLALAMTLHKGMAKRVVRDFGIPTPDFIVIKSSRDMANIDLPFPLFAKPVAEGTGKGITAASRLSDHDELVSCCTRLLSEYRQPVIVEAFLPGREFTVGIVGTDDEARAVGVMEVVLKNQAEEHAYSYLNKKRFEEFVEYRPVAGEEAEQAIGIALAAWRALECRDGGRLDLRADGAGRIHFLEVNPLPGLHPEYSDLPILCTMFHIPYQKLIGWIMESAKRRVGGLYEPPPNPPLSKGGRRSPFRKGGFRGISGKAPG